MTQDQINSLLRHVGTYLGGAISMWLLGRGWIDATEASQVTLAIAGLAVPVGMAIWGALSRRPSVMVRSVAAMPEVSGVIIASTPEGDVLAKSAGAGPGTVITKA